MGYISSMMINQVDLGRPYFQTNPYSQNKKQAYCTEAPTIQVFGVYSHACDLPAPSFKGARHSVAQPSSVIHLFLLVHMGSHIGPQ